MSSAVAVAAAAAAAAAVVVVVVVLLGFGCVRAEHDGDVGEGGGLGASSVGS